MQSWRIGLDEDRGTSRTNTGIVQEAAVWAERFLKLPPALISISSFRLSNVG